MTKTFFNSLSATIPEAEIASKGGLSYLAAATAMNLAGRPEVTFVDFGDQPFLACLGGALVAVDVPLPGSALVQRMWLPVMDRDNNQQAIGDVTVTDVNNSRQRCLVKALASVFGAGMSLYLGFDGDGPKAAKALGLTPESQLDELTPVVATLKEGGQPYIEWGVGLAACRATDESFRWEVVTWNGLPFREVLGGLMVDVDTFYRNKRQRLSLPIMDAAFNPVPANKAGVLDWNKTVMRALTKCIAFNTGYGLSVYADDFGKDEGGTKAAKAVKAAPKADAAKAAAPAKDAAKPAATPVKADTPVTTPAAAPAPAAAATVAEKAEAPAKAPEAATPASAPAAADEAVNEAVLRFKGVMHNRREVGGITGLISLFDALAVSTKFEVKDKPACYAVLLPAVTAVAGTEDIGNLLSAVKAKSAMQYLDQGSRDMVAAKLTAVAMAAGVAAGDDDLQKVPSTLIEAGVAKDEGDVMRLASLGNVPAETLDLLSAVMEAAQA